MTTSQYKIKVYKIWYEDCPEEFYIGSTKKKQLAERMSDHRQECRRGTTTKLYNLMREKGVNSFLYAQIGWSNVSDKDGQRQIEQTYIDKLKPTLNMYRAYRGAQWVLKSPEYLKYQRENKKKRYHIRKNQRTCICGISYNYGNTTDRKQHYKSQKHQEHIQLIWKKLWNSA